MQFFLTLKKNPWFQVGCKVYIQIKHYVYSLLFLWSHVAVLQLQIYQLKVQNPYTLTEMLFM